MLDGWVDNLDELVTESKLAIDGDRISDAELLAVLYARNGEMLFGRMSGSFAMTIVDKIKCEVLLVRDKFGSKPLFYANVGGNWAWASEIKIISPLLATLTLDPEGLRQSIQFHYILGSTLFTEVNQVPPAGQVRLRAGHAAQDKQYWSLMFEADRSCDRLDHWADRTEAGLSHALSIVQKRFRDVGVLLSGGVDSSLLALHASRAGFRNCVAFTARWPGDNPELESAIAVARHLGLEHHIVDLDYSGISETYPWLVWRVEEPPRHFNSFVLARLFQYAASRVETMLSGHAADALFGPIEAIRIAQFAKVSTRMRLIPNAARRAGASLVPKNGNARSSRWHSYLRHDVHSFIKRQFRVRYGSLGSAVFGTELRIFRRVRVRWNASTTRRIRNLRDSNDLICTLSIKAI